MQLKQFNNCIHYLCPACLSVCLSHNVQLPLQCATSLCLRFRLALCLPNLSPQSFSSLHLSILIFSSSLCPPSTVSYISNLFFFFPVKLRPHCLTPHPTPPPPPTPPHPDAYASVSSSCRGSTEPMCCGPRNEDVQCLTLLE